jgi:hypothetical protein
MKWGAQRRGLACARARLQKGAGRPDTAAAAIVNLSINAIQALTHAGSEKRAISIRLMQTQLFFRRIEESLQTMSWRELRSAEARQIVSRFSGKLSLYCKRGACELMREHS